MWQRLGVSWGRLGAVEIARKHGTCARISAILSALSKAAFIINLTAAASGTVTSSQRGFENG